MTGGSAVGIWDNIFSSLSVTDVLGILFFDAASV